MTCNVKKRVDPIGSDHIFLEFECGNEPEAISIETIQDLKNLHGINTEVELIKNAVWHHNFVNHKPPCH